MLINLKTDKMGKYLENITYQNVKKKLESPNNSITIREVELIIKNLPRKKSTRAK